MVATIDLATEYEHLETLQENERFKVALIEHEGEHRVLKQAKNQESVTKLHAELANIHFFSKITEARSTTFRVPKVYAFGSDWFICEYFDAPLLIARDRVADAQLVGLAGDYLAPFAAEVDQFRPYGARRCTFFLDNGKPNVRFRRSMEEFERAVPEAEKGKLVTPANARKIKSFIEDNVGAVGCGVDLEDIEPWDLYLLNDNKMGMIDVERVSIYGRRHFGASWQYLRLWADYQSPEAACAFLGEYFRRIEDDESTIGFQVLFGFKLMGFLADTVKFLEDSRREGKPVAYEPDSMRQLLQDYLAFDINTLMRRKA